MNLFPKKLSDLFCLRPLVIIKKNSGLTKLSSVEFMTWFMIYMEHEGHYFADLESTNAIQLRSIRWK